MIVNIIAQLNHKKQKVNIYRVKFTLSLFYLFSFYGYFYLAISGIQGFFLQVQTYSNWSGLEGLYSFHGSIMK